MSSTNFDKVWRSVRKERKKLSAKILKKFQEKKPELYERAMNLNKQDKFGEDEKLKRKRSFEIEDNNLIKKRKISISSDSNESSSSSSSSSESEDEK